MDIQLQAIVPSVLRNLPGFSPVDVSQSPAVRGLLATHRGHLRCQEDEGSLDLQRHLRCSGLSSPDAQLGPTVVTPQT